MCVCGCACVRADMRSVYISSVAAQTHTNTHTNERHVHDYINRITTTNMCTQICVQCAQYHLECDSMVGRPAGRRIISGISTNIQTAPIFVRRPLNHYLHTRYAIVLLCVGVKVFNLSIDTANWHSENT